jgi:hypothetical protein
MTYYMKDNTELFIRLPGLYHCIRLYDNLLPWPGFDLQPVSLSAIYPLCNLAISLVQSCNLKIAS